jgi:hypothetical protein
VTTAAARPSSAPWSSKATLNLLQAQEYARSRRRYVSSKTKTEARAKLAKARATRDEGLVFDAENMNLRKYLERWPSWLVRKRRRIETVISQITERYRAKRVWARVAGTSPRVGRAKC